MLNFITSLLFYSNEISAQKVRQALLLIGKNTSKQFLQAKQVEVAIFALCGGWFPRFPHLTAILSQW